MKLLSTTQARRRKLLSDYSLSVAGPWPGSRYYPVPDDTPYAKTLDEIQAAFDAEQSERQQRRANEAELHAQWRRSEVEAQIERDAQEAAYQAGRSRLRKSHAAEQADLTRRRAEGSYAGPLTLKEAYSLGWEELKFEHHAGEHITLKGHSLVRNANTAVSRSEWVRRGRKVKEGESPHAVVSNPFGNRYEVYRKDQTEVVDAIWVAVLDQLGIYQESSS